MEYLPGCRLGDCLENLSHQQKLCVGTDLAYIMSSLFKITASQCGSVIMRRSSPLIYFEFETHRYRALRRLDTFSPLIDPKVPATFDEQFYVGPVNDITFLDYPRQIPAHFLWAFRLRARLCGGIRFSRSASNPKNQPQTPTIRNGTRSL
jgi:hypothetical protein